MKKRDLFKNLRLLRKPLRELFLIGLVFAFIFPLLGRLHGGFWVQLLSHAIVAAILILVTTTVVLWKNAAIIEAMVEAREKFHIRTDGPLDMIFQKSLVDMVKRIQLFQSAGGLQVDNDELNKIQNSCFNMKFKVYLAVDSHVPSDYYRLYPQFLDDHRQGLQQGDVVSWRILAVERSALIADYSANKALFEQFIRWHSETGVLLGQISPDEAKSFATTQQLGTVDMGLWSQQCSILFFPPDLSPTHPIGSLKLRYLPPDNRFYNACKLYFSHLASSDSEIKTSLHGVTFENRSEVARRAALQSISNLS